MPAKTLFLQPSFSQPEVQFSLFAPEPFQLNGAREGQSTSSPVQTMSHPATTTAARCQSPLFRLRATKARGAIRSHKTTPPTKCLHIVYAFVFCNHRS